MVKTGDINSAYDLLSTRWKGKIIIADPTISGRGQKYLSIVALKLGEEYIKQLAKQEPLLTRDLRLLVDWIAKGKYLVGIGVRSQEYEPYKRAGAPVSSLNLKEVAFLEGGGGSIAYFDRAPHPHASRVFLNWLLSKEGQYINQQTLNSQSSRLDVPVDGLLKAGYAVRLPEVDYYDTTSEEWELEIRPKGTKVVMEVFMPLAR